MFVPLPVLRLFPAILIVVWRIPHDAVDIDDDASFIGNSPINRQFAAFMTIASLILTPLGRLLS